MRVGVNDTECPQTFSYDHLCILYVTASSMRYNMQKLLNKYVVWVQAVKKATPHCKKYLVKMTTSAWLLQFQGPLNRWVA